MTETGGNVTFLGPADHRAGADGDPSILATAGRPHDEVEVRIADGGSDGVGEILVRGAQVAAGYWPGTTPATLDGWLPTGDVGRMDDEGRLIVVDRLKDVIITGGENVSSREVEDVLSNHRDVDQVAVVGVPDDYWGEAICAVVVPVSGRHPAADGTRRPRPFPPGSVQASTARTVRRISAADHQRQGRQGRRPPIRAHRALT